MKLVFHNQCATKCSLPEGLRYYDKEAQNAITILELFHVDRQTDRQRRALVKIWALIAKYVTIV
jgi:hypothetical protein